MLMITHTIQVVYFALELILFFCVSFFRSITMMVRVALGTWHGESKLYKEAWLKNEEHHVMVQNVIQKSPFFS